jgi:PKD repeat protein
MRKALRILLVTALILVPCAALAWHVRLVVPSNGTPLRWAAPASIGIVINDACSDDAPDASDELAIRMAIESWNETTGTTAALIEDTSAASQARTDYEATDIHTILFDETDSSGFFTGPSGTVALTPVWFFSNGFIQDADILFNGQDHDFTTSQQPGAFDVQDVVTHELGHLLGLNHSGWAGATMYPYVDPTVILHRSLSEDEEHGLRDAYPDAAGGRITGTIRRVADSTAVAGAHVVATDASGRTTASVLANAAGNFTLPGLDPGDYTVYVVPLDSPVSVANLGTGYDVDTDFEPAFYGIPGIPSATIVGSETVAIGVLQVDADVALTLGTLNDLLPVQAIEGTSQTVILHGQGLVPGLTIDASDPDILISNPVAIGSQISFQITIPGGEPNGQVDLMVANPSGDIAILPAALEITPPPPTVTGVMPTTGSMGGGTALTITGTEFHASARVVLGDQIYRDGVGGMTVVSETTITLTTAATVPGLHDVVVIDPSGIEGRLVDAFAFDETFSVNFSATPTSGPAPLAVQFTDISGPVAATSWTWTFGDGGQSTAQHPVHNYTQTGVYTVTLSAAGPGGSDDLVRNTYISVFHPPPVADFEGTTTSGEAPLTVLFFDQSSGPVTSWLWDFGDESTSTREDPIHTYNYPGTYSVSLSVTGPGGADSETKTGHVTVAAPPAPAAAFVASPRTGPVPLAVQFQDQTAGHVFGWSWDFGDGSTSALRNPTHTYTRPGSFTVTLTVFGAGGSDQETELDHVLARSEAKFRSNVGQAAPP